ncbi:helix-turn-helix transcriptional regulator [Actinocorallia sp. A-T 12471]|uniref:helix-turn-helix transcriptional regulator n=1 Tax=Actinocorallia sp. A-T 12471 TaxID=3089813 RepID=UPI0029D2ED1C|nr:helix-turn-helix transcriptional regulator [Actinocorallia sp. A-T 12471]MDX6741261.1 helix-turn-helix transcriptional regulator [Actinocorallia sp. A-T 12471]
MAAPARLVEFEARLARQRSALDVLTTTAAAVLDRLPSDVWCTVLLDPATLLDTGGHNDAGFPDSCLPRLFEIEHVEADDPGNLRDMHRRGATTTLLSRSVSGDMEASKYYRDILRPQGLGDELRVALRDGPHVFGLLVLCRAQGAPAFSRAEEAAAHRLARPATAALTRALLLSGRDTGSLPDAAGLLKTGPDGEVRWASATASTWLDLLQDGSPAGARPLRAVAAAARASGTARSRALTRSGHWVALQAWATDAEETVVSLSPPAADELTPVILNAYGLSGREQQIAQLALRGESNNAIAAILSVSVNTLNTHLQSIYGKTGLRDRKELVSDVFYRHYVPRFGQGPLTTDGRRIPDEGE